MPTTPLPRLLTRLARFVVRTIRQSALALALIPAAACQNAESVDAAQAGTPPPPVVIPTIEVPAIAPPPPASTALGDFQMTFYYLIAEGEVAPRRTAPANDQADATLAAVAPTSPDGDSVTIYQGKSCAPLAEVSRRFAAELTLQGSGQLNDGRILNVWGNCACPRSPCFQVATEKSRWGLAGDGRPLSPFRTVAVDPKVVPLGTLLYIPELDGLRMPGRDPIGGFIHDGCVVADDTGGGVKGKQVDLFVGRKAYWQGLARRGGSHAWARHITIYPGAGRCTRQGGRVSRSRAAGM